MVSGLPQSPAILQKPDPGGYGKAGLTADLARIAAVAYASV
jgi:hypothetical protein